MKAQFHFKNLVPAPELSELAYSQLGEIEKLAPFESVAFALLERAEEGYYCAIDIYSRNTPLMATAFAEDPETAILEMTTQVKKHILEAQWEAQWNKSRKADRLLQI